MARYTQQIFITKTSKLATRIYQCTIFSKCFATRKTFHAKRNIKVKGGATEEECVAGPVLTRAWAKKKDKVQPLKVKEPVQC